MDAYHLSLLIFNTAWVRAILGLIGANVLLGVGAALFHRDYRFYLASTGDFLLNRVLPYLLGWAAVKLVAITALADFASAAMVAETAVSAFVVAALLGKIADQLRGLGLPIPSWAGAAPKQDVTATP